MSCCHRCSFRGTSRKELEAHMITAHNAALPPAAAGNPSNSTRLKAYIDFEIEQEEGDRYKQ